MIDKDTYIKILNSPIFIQQENMTELKSAINAYPYFQSARALYLKALKNQDSFKYNNELKITAAYTSDRSILFDFITSEVFNATAKVVVEKVEPIAGSVSEKKTEKEITDAYIELIPKEYSQEIIEVKKDLEIGKPLHFTKKETHSFYQWLQLSAEKPVVRKLIPEENQAEKIYQNSIIDQFIANNPKISKVNKASAKEIEVGKISHSNELMTETLAKVYLEQKKYENAIQAYKILSLKYPEKSSFFANQIKRIEILQKS